MIMQIYWIYNKGNILILDRDLPFVIFHTRYHGARNLKPLPLVQAVIITPLSRPPPPPNFMVSGCYGYLQHDEFLTFLITVHVFSLNQAQLLKSSLIIIFFLNNVNLLA
jgi:hypothetical protein